MRERGIDGVSEIGEDMRDLSFVSPEKMEAMAEAEHVSWSGWTKWMLKCLEKDLVDHPACGPGQPRLRDLPCVKRWLRQINTPYPYLSESEKESDREVVREKWPAYAVAAIPGNEENDE